MPVTFLLEVVLRSVVMFVIITITLRASGKRGIKQLSIFELVLIIGLGSAAGDPMFYEDVGILPALTVFIVIISLYIGITKLTDKFRWFELILEGKPLYVIREGNLIMDSFKESGLSKDEFFSELRQQNVEHLGQVKTVLIETSGEISILFYPDEEVKPGLPIFPHELTEATKDIPLSGLFCCSQCGQLDTLPAGTHHCSGCTCEEWVTPSQSKRIA
ncbi:protein of unknown function DUF421 [Arcticibacter svalbardensis MN12-7]|uniref:YetF C-terminal domain-containing protein n=2 Tax=Arcticibacter TaxID=1288026 RepID=R9GRA4_9SPHI|nr:protein of unknown function DUF421 [Arcticibacter svalbardensis MN12-7]